MLIVLTAFLAKYGVKAESELKDFKLNRKENVQWFRESVFHYLDLSTVELFPNRNMHQLKDVEINKKINVTTIRNLTRTEGLGPIKDRQRGEKISKWFTDHTKTFKEVDLIETKIADMHTVPIVNYNPIKFNHGYTSSRLQNYEENYNYLQTYADVFTKHVKEIPNKKHVVTFNVPNIIPGFKALRNLMAFDKLKQALVVNDRNTFWFIEWYKWMSSSTRKESVFKDITDEESKNIILEITSRGYVTYIPLHILRSLSKDCAFPALTKLEDIKHRKFFIKYIYLIQEKMYKLSSIKDKELVLDDDDHVTTEDDINEPIENNKIRDQNENILPDEDGELTDFEHEHEDEAFVDNFNIRGSDSRSIQKKTEDAYISALNDDSLFEELDDLDNLSLDVFEVDIKDIPKLERAKKELKKRKYDETPQEVISDEVMEEEVVNSEPMTYEEKQELLRKPGREEFLENYIRAGTSSGILSTAEIKALRRNNEKRKRLKDVYTGELVDDTINSKSDLKEIGVEIGESHTKAKLIPQDLKSTKIKAFDDHYREKMMKKDIIDSIYVLESSKVTILDHQIKKTKSVADNYEEHKITMKPHDGDQSTLTIRLPIVDRQGSFMINGVKYKMRKTRQDLPIRKISPTRVSLQSNYGKFFVSKTERMAYNRDAYIDKQVRRMYLEGTGNIKQIVPGVKRLNKEVGICGDYAALASKFDSITTNEVKFIFSEEETNKVLSEETKKKIKSIRTNIRFIGAKIKTGDALVVNTDDVVMTFPDMTPVGRITDLLGIEPTKIPKTFTSMNVIGKEIPLVVTMGYYVGLTNLIRITDTKFQLFEKKPKADELGPFDEVFRFQDYFLVLTLQHFEQRNLFHGLFYFAKVIKDYRLSDFDSKSVYLNLLESRNLGLFHLRELDNLDDWFLDPITIDVLKEINEPTEFRNLLLRANILLNTHDHPDINDPLYCRIRGDDRIPGLMYRAMVASMREYRLKGGKTKKIALDPYKVWNQITQDNSVKTREVLNPILAMKEESVVVLTGVDGFNTGAVPIELRSYHENDVGLISEGTIDSGNVALVTYASPYMKVKNSRGIVKDDIKEFQENPAKIFSSAAMLAPLVQFDDQLR